MKKLIKEVKSLSKTKRLQILTLALLGVISITLGYSYAFFEEKIVGGNVDLRVGELSYNIQSDSLNDAYQVTVGAGSESIIEITVTSLAPVASKYQMVYRSDNDLTNVVVGYSSESVELPSGEMEANGIKTVTVVVQNNSSSPVTVTFGVKGGLAHNSIEDIILASNEHKLAQSIELQKVDECILVENGEDTSNANAPELTSGMIPVIYDECEKTWKKADTAGNWYNYDTQNWTNAVTVTETTRANYMSAEAGSPIDINDINTMWVWIPRYEYQYTNLGNQYAGGTQEQPGEIKINFISSTQTSPSDNAVYKIPEGFKFGEEELSGFWMAKFETSTLETCTASDESVETDCDLTTFTPQVKPNAISWRGARVSTFFQASRLMQDSTSASKYDFDTIGTSSMDVHMLKNTEWGIVAMLSQSKYGKYGNPNYEGVNKEVYQNKSSEYITGMSNGTPGQETLNTQVTYDTPDTGYGASTTGTIYGVYDMSGGAFEYVMGNYSNIVGDYALNSGFEGLGAYDNWITGLPWPDSKYYDLYTVEYDASEGYKAGDATYETSGWYSDCDDFVLLDYPWFERGGVYAYNTEVGIFGVYSAFGSGDTGSGFRLAIKP